MDYSTENQRMRTIDAYNMRLIPEAEYSIWGFPLLEPTDFTPAALIGFNQAKSTPKRRGKTAHFFIDDYQFERLWRFPERYLLLLGAFEAVLGPDFSTYTDMPEPMQRWNVYRSRALARFWQDRGITVVPTLQWADEDSLMWCFDGLPEASTLAVSSVGARKSREHERLYRVGLEAALEWLQPSRLIHYGRPLDVDYGDTEVVVYDNETIKRMEASRWEVEAAAAV